MPYLFIVIAILVVVNFYMLFKRNRKSRNIGKEASKEREESVKRYDNLVRKLSHEQEEAARRVELQNKTFDMYDQVRRHAAETETEHEHEQEQEQEQKQAVEQEQEQKQAVEQEQETEV